MALVGREGELTSLEDALLDAHRRIASSSTASKWATDPVRLDLKGIDEPVKAFRLAPPKPS
jgi:hypothetical protein